MTAVVGALGLGSAMLGGDYETPSAGSNVALESSLEGYTIVDADLYVPRFGGTADSRTLMRSLIRTWPIFSPIVGHPSYVYGPVGLVDLLVAPVGTLGVSISTFMFTDLSASLTVASNRMISFCVGSTSSGEREASLSVASTAGSATRSLSSGIVQPKTNLTTYYI